MATRHFLSVLDLSAHEARAVLELGHHIKRAPGDFRDRLRDRTLAMIFQKRSTRTRVSFEVGAFELGGHALFLSSQDIQIGRGETIADTARVLSRYCAGLMARVYGHEVLEELAAHADVPVINGLSDQLHPCQTMADAMTLIEHFTPGDGFDTSVLRGRKLAYVGDAANNMANSLLYTGALLGMDVVVVGPPGYQPAAEVVSKARSVAAASGADITVTEELSGVQGAHCVYTDVWTSMGQEEETHKRLVDLGAYQVNAALMARASADAVFMHCLPAHRGEEVSAEVCDGQQSIIFDQAENRLHAQKALMVHLMA